MSKNPEKSKDNKKSKGPKKSKANKPQAPEKQSTQTAAPIPMPGLYFIARPTGKHPVDWSEYIYTSPVTAEQKKIFDSLEARLSRGRIVATITLHAQGDNGYYADLIADFYEDQKVKTQKTFSTKPNPTSIEHTLYDISAVLTVWLDDFDCLDFIDRAHPLAAAAGLRIKPVVSKVDGRSRITLIRLYYGEPSTDEHERIDSGIAKIDEIVLSIKTSLPNYQNCVLDTISYYAARQLLMDIIRKHPNISLNFSADERNVEIPYFIRLRYAQEQLFGGNVSASDIYDAAARLTFVPINTENIEILERLLNRYSKSE